ncbi:MAG: MFS transporter [Sphingomonas sp.]|nr:MFS transporter [Sphingomonas sp.]
MADMQAGIGPFLGVFLQGKGWATGAIGSVMTIGGIAGMLMTAPAGALIDSTKQKRWYVIVSGIFTVLASSLIWFSQATWVVALSQVATAIAGAAIGPAVAGITLGIVRQKGFNRQNGRNQAWNHAGNMVGAGLSGLLGWKFGFGAVFLLAALFGLLAIVSVLLIPEKEIDHQAARGLEKDEDDEDAEDGKAEGFKILLHNKPLLILAASLAFFHLGNGALLPLYTLAVAKTHVNPALFAAEMIVVAQAVMIVTAICGMRMAEGRGYWLVILLTFLILPVRGVLASCFITSWGVFPVQVLDGIAAGLQSVAVPGLVARILAGTGRVNVGQGAVMTVQGVGAALSPAIGGWIVHFLGYPVTFLILGGFALGSVALWIGAASILKPACAGRPDAKLKPLAA